MESADSIRIEDLEVSCRVGVTNEERSVSQILFISITISSNLKKAGLSDQLKDTIDYADVMKDVRNLIEGKTFWLIESVCEKVAELILGKYKVEVVLVDVSKRSLPGVKSVTVSMTRRS